MSSSAGKVLILPKGEYNNATQYQMLDAVRYNGSLYIAKQTTIGHVPEDGEYWMLSAIGASDVHWGDITGSIASQSDLINALDAKQNVLTFDSTPTASSNNPVTSAGIKTALDTKQDTLTFDTTPTSGSTNPVTSGGIHTAVQATASNLATIESSTTASQAYSEGDYLVLNGQLYEVIADIASGETLTVGTNISATTVGSELTALNNGLMQGLGAKLLWSGNFTGSGSLTVDGLSEWFVVGYTSYESATNVEYLMIGTPSRGGLPYGVYDATSTTVVAYRFLVSGDTITVNSANRGLYFSSSTTYNNGAEAHIRHIFGIIKKPQS